MCLGKAVEERTSAWALAPYVGEPDEALNSWLWCGPAPGMGDNLGSGQAVGRSLSLSLSLCIYIYI